MMSQSKIPPRPSFVAWIWIPLSRARAPNIDVPLASLSLWFSLLRHMSSCHVNGFLLAFSASLCLDGRKQLFPHYDQNKIEVVVGDSHSWSWLKVTLISTVSCEVQPTNRLQMNEPTSLPETPLLQALLLYGLFQTWHGRKQDASKCDTRDAFLGAFSAAVHFNACMRCRQLDGWELYWKIAD